jgi:hypothetical protein
MVGAEVTLPCLDGLFQRGTLGAEGRQVRHKRAFRQIGVRSGIRTGQGCTTPGLRYCPLR